MLENEADWIGGVINNIDSKEITTIVMLGSRRDLYGEHGQNFIYQKIIKPGEDRGIRFVHTDLEDGEGVDIPGDLYSDDVCRRIKEYGPSMILCCNLLEHVRDPNSFLARCFDLIPAGGYVLVTVPHKFPYHPAPIDTMYRPTTKEIGDIYAGCIVLKEETVDCGTFLGQLVKKPSLLVRHIGQMLLFVPNYRRSMSAFHRNIWLFRNYKVSSLLLKKTHSELEDS